MYYRDRPCFSQIRQFLPFNLPFLLFFTTMAYYIRFKGKPIGPYEESQLLEMKSKGKLARTTEISEDKVDWHNAEEFDFLGFQRGESGTPSEYEPADWFYSENGKDGYGPVTATTIREKLQSGQLSGNSYVWQQGQNARFIKDESFFSGTGVASPPSSPPPPPPSDGDPLAASLGWLMFLKVVFLIVGIVIEGLFLLWWGVFSISRIVAADDAAMLLVTLIGIVFWAGLYGLQFKTFLCFWKYHNDLSKSVAMGRSPDFLQAEQSLLLFWKWLSITVIANLAVIVICITTVMIAFGWFVGYAQRLFLF